MSREVGKLTEVIHPQLGRGFRGRIATAVFSGAIRLVPASKRGANSPDFAVEMQSGAGDPIHIGAAWWQRSTGKNTGLPYLSASLSAPGVPSMRVAIFAEDDAGLKSDADVIDKAVPNKADRPWRIVWNPPQPQSVQKADAALAINDAIPF